MAVRLALIGVVSIVVGALKLGEFGVITTMVGAVVLAVSGIAWITARRSSSS